MESNPHKPDFKIEDAVNLYLYLVKAGKIKDNPPMTREQAIEFFQPDKLGVN